MSEVVAHAPRVTWTPRRSCAVCGQPQLGPVLVTTPSMPTHMGCVTTKPEDDVLKAVVELNKLFESLPQKGAAPAFVKSTVVDGGKGTLKVSLTVPQATLVELSKLAATMR